MSAPKNPISDPNTQHGDIEFGFYRSVAPITVDHIFKLVRLGGYNTNHFFRIDKGFVAQVADVSSGRSAPMNEEQRRQWLVSSAMSSTSEAFFLWEDTTIQTAPNPLFRCSSSRWQRTRKRLTGTINCTQYLTLQKLEQLPNRKEGMFVMPTERVTILSSHYYDTETENCPLDRLHLKRRLAASQVEIEKQRRKCFP